MGFFLFCRRGESSVLKKNKSSKKRTQKGKNKVEGFFVRAGRAGRTDLTARIPELSHLHKKTVTVIGLGCLGAPSVLELARCGVGEIRIIDFDIVEAGTVVRWPFGLTAVGRHKTEAISDFIKANYPFTKIVPFTHKIGAVRLSENQASDLKILESALNNTDLVFDASAERGVQYLMSNLAAELNIPYIGISTTFGAWGGMLIRLRPQITEGCWRCFLGYLDDQTIPIPSADPNGEFQPVGCADPTFTGSGFDTGVIALSGVRLAVSTLTDDQKEGYPSFDWDIAVVNFRDDQGNAIVPSWKTFSIKKHPSCSCSKNV